RLASLGKPVRVRLFSSASYVQDARSQNVIAEVRGRERPEEIVLLGAHMDSWDQGTGAIDDGTGMAIIVAAAKLIRDVPHRPRRTEAGVPSFTLSQDASRYFETHHTHDDTLDKIDRSQRDQNVAAWAALVWLAADSDVDFRARPGTAPREPLR